MCDKKEPNYWLTGNGDRVYFKYWDKNFPFPVPDRDGPDRLYGYGAFAPKKLELPPRIRELLEQADAKLTEARDLLKQAADIIDVHVPTRVDQGFADKIYDFLKP